MSGPIVTEHIKVRQLPPISYLTYNLICFPFFTQDYCGSLSEDAIRKNFPLIYELLDEVVDYGTPQSTSTEALKTFVLNEATVVMPPVSHLVLDLRVLSKCFQAGCPYQHGRKGSGRTEASLHHGQWNTCIAMASTWQGRAGWCHHLGFGDNQRMVLSGGICNHIVPLFVQAVAFLWEALHTCMHAGLRHKVGALSGDHRWPLWHVVFRIRIANQQLALHKKKG